MRTLLPIIRDYSLHYFGMILLTKHSGLRAMPVQLLRSQLRFPSLSIASRLLSTLAVLEQREGKLQSPSLAAIAAAQKLGGPVTGFVAGSGIKGTAAAEAAKVKGVEKVLAVENDAYEKVRERPLGQVSD